METTTTVVAAALTTTTTTSTTMAHAMNITVPGVLIRGGSVRLKNPPSIAEQKHTKHNNAQTHLYHKLLWIDSMLQNSLQDFFISG